VAAAHRLVSVGYRTPASLHGLRVVERIPALHVAEVTVGGARGARQLRARAGIRFVHALAPRAHTGGPDLPATVSSLPEWQWAATHEDLVPGWVQQAASRVTIAVVDTGADLTAPALAARAPVSWNVVTSDTAVSDDVGHGTFVASLAGGAMLGFGGDVRLEIVQANDGGGGFSDVDEANAIVWAVDHGANIVNLSLGGPETSVVERYAIDYAISKGVLLVAAAGNAARDGNPTMYPAALIGRNGLVVGASDAAGKRAPFSTTGSYVDLLAPGVNVLGAVAKTASNGLFTLTSTPGTNGAYGYGTGTSYSAPEVAGAAALVMAANPSLSSLGVAQALDQTASGNGVWTKGRAFGVVNVAAAVQRALGN
jgi:subtilisin family serine protease